ncbi:MAG: rhodanese-like domain-containing protein [Flavobacterium sp.]|nr:MAG: rhodanese-like domain-containing protein [Flavobacterium sp.]
MKINLKFVLIIFISFGMMSCKQPASGTQPEQNAEQSEKQDAVRVVNSEEFSSRINAVGDVQLIDVRTPEEVAEGTIAGAINFDFRAEGFEEKLKVLNKDKAVYVFCRSGGRSGNAAAIMKELGFAEIYDLEGGVIAWKEDGRELVK